EPGMPFQQLNHALAHSSGCTEYSNLEFLHDDLLPSVSIFTIIGVAFTPCFSNTVAIARPTVSASAGLANANTVGPAPLNATPSKPDVVSPRISSNPGINGARYG